MQQSKPITAKGGDTPHTATVDQSNTFQAIAIIGAELIAYRVNRKPEQRSHLLDPVQMADTLGALNAADRNTLAANLECIGGAQ
jgi:hypothetical protein